MTVTKERYRVAEYSRLSREDGDKTESDSIINQQHIIEDFCARFAELVIVDRYSDDGWTGTNFNRPDFKRMIDDIEAGKINCVIVKDLSRFGRDYIDMGFYLERFFPSKGVRFIAINDSIDSKSGPYDMMMPLKNVFNAQYAKDTSDKVRKSFLAKQRRGEFVSAFPPYGYAKDPEDKNHFIIDPVAAQVVQRIFKMAAEGVSYRKIAGQLNQDSVLSPLEYKRNNGIKLFVPGVRGKSYWSDSAVKRILTNEVYLGNMVSNRYPSDTMHGKNRLAPKAEWIIVENMHEPIVTRELWDSAQRAPAIAYKAESASGEEHIGLFSGMVRCGDCGRALTRKGGNSRIYICSGYKDYGDIACTRHAIAEDTLADLVLSDLNKIIAEAGNIQSLAECGQEFGVRVERTLHDEKRLEAALARIRRMKQSLYEDYRGQTISREEFMRQKTAYDRQEAEIENRICERPNIVVNPPAQDKWTEQLASMGKLKVLDRQTVKQTIQQIKVYDDGRIEISYLFSEQLKGILENNNAETR